MWPLICNNVNTPASSLSWINDTPLPTYPSPHVWRKPLLPSFPWYALLHLQNHIAVKSRREMSRRFYKSLGSIWEHLSSFSTAHFLTLCLLWFSYLCLSIMSRQHPGPSSAAGSPHPRPRSPHCSPHPVTEQIRMGPDHWDPRRTTPIGNTFSRAPTGLDKALCHFRKKFTVIRKSST